MTAQPHIRPAAVADAEAFLALVAALAEYEKLGAARLGDWLTLRLSRERLLRLADLPGSRP